MTVSINVKPKEELNIPAPNHHDVNQIIDNPNVSPIPFPDETQEAVNLNLLPIPGNVQSLKEKLNIKPTSEKDEANKPKEKDQPLKQK